MAHSQQLKFIVIVTNLAQRRFRLCRWQK